MGSPIIQLNSGAFQAGLSLYGIVNPSTGTIVASTSAIRNAVVTAMLFSGVYQSTPIGTAATQTQISSSAINTGSATGVDSTGLFAAGASLYPGSITVTADDGSANAIDDLPDGSLQVRGHSVWIAGSASHTYAATISSSAYHSAFCVYLNAAPVGPTYYPLSRRRRTFFPVFFPR
jgi:hypothetical protein